MNEKQETFQYTYSAAQQAEIKRIREKYTPPIQAEDKMVRLRKLDQSVTRPGTLVSLLVGILSCLILGFGMSCALVWAQLLPGILIGGIGIIGLLLAYPIYKRMTNKQREKLTPEILRLSDELMQ